MKALLVILALLALVFYVFGALFRRRVRSNLERAGIELPPELLRPHAATAKPAAAVRSAAMPVGAAAAAPRVATIPVLHYMLIYDVAPDFSQRRTQFRDEHLALAWKAAQAGELVLAGALEEPTEQALLLFRGSREAAARFAAADPYVRHGLVRQWRVKQWHTVAGETAAMPLRPKNDKEAR